MLTSLAMFATLSIPAPPASPAQVPQPIPRIRLADYLPPLAEGSRDFEERRAFLARMARTICHGRRRRSRSRQARICRAQPCLSPSTGSGWARAKHGGRSGSPGCAP